tara:strand:- start:692 stop:1147 length:456 start_codon:yes stop_codon:yes gene_type:complete
MIGLDTSAVDATAQFKLGTIFSNIGANGPSKDFKYVKWEDGGGAAGVVGEAAYYHAAGGYQDSLVSSDVSESINLGAGIIQSILTDGTFGWIQISGPATLTIALTAGADGNALTAVGTADGALDVSGAVTDAVVAFADDISAKEIVCMFPR